jgi:hypothetical protein
MKKNIKQIPKGILVAEFRFPTLPSYSLSSSKCNVASYHISPHDPIFVNNHLRHVNFVLASVFSEAF